MAMTKYPSFFLRGEFVKLFWFDYSETLLSNDFSSIIFVMKFFNTLFMLFYSPPPWGWRWRILYTSDLNSTLGCGTSLPPCCFPLDTGLDLLWFKDWLGLDWMTGGIGLVWLLVPRVGLVWMGGGAGFWWGEEKEFAAGISSSLDLLFPALFFHFLT